MSRPPFSGYEYTNPRRRKLSREQVLDAVARYEAGERVKDIAARYGVTDGAISYHLAKHTVLRRDRPPRRIAPTQPS